MSECTGKGKYIFLETALLIFLNISLLTNCIQFHDDCPIKDDCQESDTGTWKPLVVFMQSYLPLVYYLNFYFCSISILRNAFGKNFDLVFPV